jgi:hypothetical protein
VRVEEDDGAADEDAPSRGDAEEDVEDGAQRADLRAEDARADQHGENSRENARAAAVRGLDDVAHRHRAGEGLDARRDQLGDEDDLQAEPAQGERIGDAG